MQKGKVSVIGLGYVGLPLACAIAKSKKYKVIGVDLDEQKVAAINSGICPIDDQETTKLLPKVEMKVSTDQSSIKGSEFIIICVPTPVGPTNLPDLTPVRKAAENAAKHLEKGQTIIIESTINPGVCEEVVLPILEESGLKGGGDFELTHCPERINPGDNEWSVNNIARNIGSLTREGNKTAADFYRSFLKAEVNEVSCLKVAEATKVIENTFRDINIAYVNELAKSFDLMGIDLVEVIRAASNKPFAFMPHFPGCGVGGHCIPVDPYYLIERAKMEGFEHSFLRNAREINNSMPGYAVNVLSDMLNEFEKPIHGTHIALLGLAYKGNVSDLRESPALEIKKILEKKGAILSIYDPHLPKISTTPSIVEALAQTEFVFIATEHKEFKEIPAERFKELGTKLIVDGKNCLDKEAILAQGISYKGIGH